MQTRLYSVLSTLLILAGTLAAQTLGDVSGEVRGCVAGCLENAPVGEDLNAARPVRQKRERRSVVQVEAAHADRAGDVLLGRDFVLAVRCGIQAIYPEKLRSGRQDGGTEEILELPLESADGHQADALFLAAKEHRYDVVVYGGTAGGIVSAVAARQEGATVVVIEPTAHVGGMATGGLGWTDKGVEGTVGGMSRRLYERAYEYYQEQRAWKFEQRAGYLERVSRMVNENERVWWAIEPSVAVKVLNRFAAESKTPVLTGQRLKAVRKVTNRIESITTDNGDVFLGRVFIDATYEGDLLAMAGVPYRVGREGRHEYGEELAGVVPEEWSTRKQWEADIRPLNPENIARKGEAINLTGPKGGSLLKIDPLPNRKTDINDGGPFSTDHIGANWNYPDGDHEARRRILQDHVDYTKGLL